MSESTLEPAQVIAYASPGMTKPRITFRGAVTTLIVGGAFLLLAIGLVLIAWSIFREFSELQYRRGDSLEILGTFVSVLAGISFFIGTIIAFIGLRGVRQRELN
ncbi:MAG: hypothetical protein JWN40_199 [Phycisphaerales bacterium]|jgi:hypothetical protein|nr:hypothetical protein [Phycisphaerales bacterium]